MRERSPCSLAALMLPLLACAVGSENNGSATTVFGSGPSMDTSTAGSGSSADGTGSGATGPSTTGTADSSSPDSSSGGAGETGPAECGNGVLEGDEGCDEMDLGGQTCVDFGFDEGLLTCTPGCVIVTDACFSCGDGTKAFMETCDENDFGGETCQSMGFGGGTLGCSADCQTIDTSGCEALPSCGDGMVNGGEQCDAGDLGGATCVTQGFDIGQLSCTQSCTYDTSGCDYDVGNCGQMGDLCVFDENDPQSTCCPPGVGGNVFGICDVFICV